jgi:hypothetical protein
LPTAHDACTFPGFDLAREPWLADLETGCSKIKAQTISGAPTRYPATDAPAPVEDLNAYACLVQFTGGAEPGNACTDDCH